MIFFGIAFAFKMRALFYLPIVMLLWLFKRIRTWELVFIPLMYAVSLIPALIAGRPFGQLLAVYFNQAGEDTNRLSMKYPNIYYIIGELNLPEWYSDPGKLFAVCVILLL